MPTAPRPGSGRGVQRVEKASQSFAPAGAKEIEIMFPGGVYLSLIHI